VGLDDLNTLTNDAAIAEFLRCCGSDRWAGGMAAARPFASIEAVYAASDNISSTLDASDWLEAFRAHPRIGGSSGSGRSAESGASRGTAQWSKEEQAGARGASDAVRTRLAIGNRDYEARFGYIFIVCATGKTGGEMLAELERRLAHEPGEELEIAAAEQRKITRLRLAKLLDAT
jgi:OHCU decarboxylase